MWTQSRAAVHRVRRASVLSEITPAGQTCCREFVTEMGPTVEGGILNAEERDTMAEDVCCNTQARFLHSEVDRSDADEIRFPLKAFPSR